MFRKTWFAFVLLGGSVFLAACYPPQSSPTPGANMPNPASGFCELNGGKLELRQDASGGVAGVCLFPDGSECDEWAYFRGECKPAGTRVTSEPTSSPVATGPAPTAVAEVASDGWRIYRNEQLGYSFHYPADASITTGEDPLRTVSIVGPLTGNDHWPIIQSSHPSDRADYRPPEGVDLEKWLTDHNLLMTGGQQPTAEVRQPNMSIAGTTAIHTRLARSPQTYAYDKYFFAKSQQLYVVVIIHTADKEDWELYNHFLESIEVR